MHIPDGNPEKKSSEEREEGIADQPVAEWHCSAVNSAEEPVSHHEIITMFEAPEEFRNVPKIVTQIRITHDHIFPRCRRDATPQRIPVTALLHIDHRCPMLPCNFWGTISASVIRNDDFSCDFPVLKRGLNFFDACSECLLLVQAGEDDAAAGIFGIHARILS